MDRMLLVGLGNPGLQYEGSRHNCGFDTLDLFLELAKQEGRVRELPGTRFSACLWQVEMPALPGSWLFAKPMTFMNESGRAVQPLLAWYKMKPEELLVIHDELDLPPGRLRFKFAGGNAGHNGLKSICQCLGTPNFYRLRIGIGRPPSKAGVVGWVLGKAREEEREQEILAMQEGLNVLAVFTKDGLSAASARANSFGKN